MTRGGVRKGAGRPTTKGDKLTANLCGIRITPTELANIKRAAAAINTPMGKAVRDALAFWCADMFRIAESVAENSRAIERFYRARKKPTI